MSATDNINVLNIRPIFVEPLTENDLKYGMTDDASALININGRDYQIEKKGRRIVFDVPITREDLRTSTVHLYMYDRQPKTVNDCYFTVNSPSDVNIVDGVVDIVFVQSFGHVISFCLRDAQEYIAFLKKSTEDIESMNLVPWYKQAHSIRDDILKVISNDQS
jgi:hypothetical protein